MPLLLVAAVSIAVGLLAAALFLKSQLDFAFRMPGIASGRGGHQWSGDVALIIATTFPLLSRMTGPEVAAAATPVPILRDGWANCSTSAGIGSHYGEEGPSLQRPALPGPRSQRAPH